jgi:RNA ligase
MIHTVQDISRLLVAGFSDWGQFGYVDVKTNGVMTLFNYSPMAAVNDVWLPFERLSRGLIINNQTGEIIARPFDKFFNYGQGGRYPEPGATIEQVTDKIDGSLGILYTDANDGVRKIATRGSFDGEQAQWATRFLQQHHAALATTPLGVPTLLFEIVYPQNRIVVDYGDKEGLILLAAREPQSGRYLSYSNLLVIARQFGLEITPDNAYRNGYEYMAEAEDIQRYLAGKADHNFEGFVAHFSDGSLFKFKSAEYLRVHRLVSSLSFNRVLEAIRDGKIDDWSGAIPEDLRVQVDSWRAAIVKQVDTLCAVVESAYTLSPRNRDQKTFALWAKKEFPGIAPYLFRRHAGKEYLSYIFKTHEFKEVL